MTKRDFFILLIKLFGLMSVITSVFSVIPTNISFAFLHFDLISLAWITLASFVIIGLFVVLVFKAGKLVSLLKLDRGFDDEKIELGNLTAADIVKVGTFIIGGLLIINNIPTFLSYLFFAFKGSIDGLEITFDEKLNMVISGIKIFIGYLLLTNYSFVAKLLGNKKVDVKNPS